MIEGKALSIAHGCEAGNGFEMWRRGSVRRGHLALAMAFALHGRSRTIFLVGILSLILGVLATGFCVSPAYKAWGAPAAMAAFFGGFFVTLVVPFGGVATVAVLAIVIKKARTKNMQALMEKMDADP